MTTKKITTQAFHKAPELELHSKRSKAVARALDQKAELLPHSQTVTSLALEDFVRQLPPRRIELLRLVGKESRSISDLASATRRDQRAVSRDIVALVKLGLVSVEIVLNPGQSRKKLVQLAATTVSITSGTHNVTELKGMFGKARTPVSIQAMNKTSAARGGAAR